jgi:hypothetical protein
MENKRRMIPKNLNLAKKSRIDYKNTAQNILYQENKHSFLAKNLLNASNPFQTFVKSLLLSAYNKLIVADGTFYADSNVHSDHFYFSDFT